MLILNIKKIIFWTILFFFITTTISKCISEDDFIHFLSVKEGDCILIEDDGKYTLIDSGEPRYYEYIIDYLKNLEVNELDNIIFTHAHIDHIGCLDKIINNNSIKVNRVYGCDYSKQFQYINKEEDFNMEYIESYYRLMESIKNKECKFIVPYENMKISLGNSAKVTFFNTNIDMSNNTKMNDTSLCLQYENENDKVLLSSDIVFSSEKRILDKLSKVDVCKIPHHGYNTSSSWEFIEKINPQYCILTSERVNDVEVLAKFKYKNINIYSTFDNGNIVLKSTGNGVTFENLKETLVNNSIVKYKDKIYYLDESGSINKKEGLLKVKTKEVSGYCNLNYLEILEGQDIYSNKMLNYKVKENVKNLNVRKYPNIEIKPIGTINEGDLVKVIDIKGDWANIIFDYNYEYMLFDENGVCKTGFQRVDNDKNKMYYFSKYNGFMLKEKWINEKEKVFYLKPNGEMASNEVYEINGIKYTFDKYGHLKYINDEKFNFKSQFETLPGDK